MKLQELLAMLEKAKADGKAAVKAGDENLVKEMQQEVARIGAEMKAEILFAKDEKEFSLIRQAQAVLDGKDEVKGKTGKDEPENKIESVEYQNAVLDDLRGMANKDQVALIQEVNGHNTGNTGTIIPETIIGGIWRKVDELYPLWAAVPKTRVRGKVSYQRNVGNNAPLAWVAENAQTQGVTFTFDELNLDGHELSLFVPVSFKLEAMSRGDFLSHIQNELAILFGQQLSRAVYVGNGTNQGTGIRTYLLANATGQLVNVPASGITYKHLTTAFSKIKSGIKSGTVVYANNATIWNQLANIVDGQNRPIFIPDPTGQTVGRLFGRPVIESAEIPDNEVMIANMARGMRANINEDIRLAMERDNMGRVSKHFIYAIVDFGVLNPEAFVILRRGT